MPTYQHAGMGETRLVRILIGSDLHGPYLDRIAYGCFLAAAASFPWDLVVLNGDVCDFSQISRHEKQIGGKTRDVRNPVSLSDELQLVRHDILAPLRKATGPKTRILMRLGNHEMRWLAQAESDPRVLAEMVRVMRAHESVHLEDVLDLETYDIEISYSSIDRLYGSFTLIHGVKSSAGAAKANLLRYGSGTSGHSHRMNCHTQVMHGKLNGWWESGCLRTTDDVEYLPHGDKPDWANGFLTLSINPDNGHFYCNSHFVIDGACEVRGQVLEG